MKKKFLYNEKFVLWCLSPTSESDKYWSEYMNSNPEEIEAINSARQVLQSAKFNIAEQSIRPPAQLWHRIEKGMHGIDSKKRKMSAMRYAAAAVAVFIVIAGMFITFKNTDTSHISIDEPVVVEKVDINSNEIVLIRDDNDVMEIENNAVIEYDNDITIQTQNNTKTIASKKSDKKDMNKLIVPYGRHTSVVLSDGSRVWLNAGSTVKFPTTFDSIERRIHVEGEIYIEVAKDSERPFFVETSNMNVNVLGTKFNVSAYADDVTHSVVLLEGKVNVATNATSNYTLKPNQKLSYTNNNADIDNVNAEDYVSWKDGVFQLRNNNMDEVAQRLSRYYNTTIRCSDQITNKRLSGKLLLFDDINQVMETFSMLYNVNYRLEGGVVVIE